MPNFFSYIAGTPKANLYAPVFDWLFQEERFPKPAWEARRKQAFTGKLSELFVTHQGLFRKCQKDYDYPKNSDIAVIVNPTALFSVSDSIGVDFTRHLRNGIAHGHIDVRQKDTDGWLLLTDFCHGRQNAYVSMPVSWLLRIYETHELITAMTSEELKTLHLQKARSNFAKTKNN